MSDASTDTSLPSARVTAEATICRTLSSDTSRAASSSAPGWTATGALDRADSARYSAISARERCARASTDHWNGTTARTPWIARQRPVTDAP